MHYSEKKIYTGQPEYSEIFLNVMRGGRDHIAATQKVYDGASRIYAKYCDDISSFVPENGSVPIFDGMNDFTVYDIESHKQASFIRLDFDFVHDSSFIIETYLVNRFAKNFAAGEDKAFITGTGTYEPIGVLHDTKGAETAITTNSITYDDIISLYFSLKSEYCKNAVWLMNDATALA